MDSVTQVNGILRVCCADPANRTTEQVERGIYVSQCRVCERNHYRMVAEPGHYTRSELHQGAKELAGNQYHIRRSYFIGKK